MKIKNTFLKLEVHVDGLESKTVVHKESLVLHAAGWKMEMTLPLSLRLYFQ